VFVGVSLDKGERALDFAREIFREHHKEAKRSEKQGRATESPHRTG
jgi:hypothetical protein